MVMGTMLNVQAGENNPVKHGNTIRGHVIEKYSEEHLPYAAILIVETGAGAVSDESGHFRFKDIPAGTYTLRVQLLGYATQEKQVTVSKEYTTDVHFAMEEETIMTEEVVVSANRNEVNNSIIC